MKPLPSHRLLYALFLISGFSGLVYETLWIRQLSLILGATMPTISLVLSSFMAGLGLGSFCASRLLKSVSIKPLKLYVLIESLIALLGALYCLLFSQFALSSKLLSLFPQKLGIVLILLIPSMLMGATFPILVRHLSEQGFAHKTVISWLYGLNTLGAVLGCLSTDFLLIRFWGQGAACIAAVLGNILAALLAWALYVPSRQRLQIENTQEETTQNTEPLSRMQIFWLFGLAAFLGFIALSYEVLWSRAILLYSHWRIYAFSLLLGIYLLGTAFGSIVMGKVVDRLKNPKQLLLILLGICLLWLSMGQLILVHLDPWVISIRDFAQNAFGLSHFASIYLRLSILLMLLLFIPTSIWGALFSLIASLLSPHAQQSHKSAGLCYALNCLGSIAGAYLAGFWLLPKLGLGAAMNSLLFASIVVTALSIGALHSQSFKIIIPCIVGALGIGLFLPNNYLYKNTFLKRFDPVIYMHDGLYESVAIEDNQYLGKPLNRFLITNGYRMSANNARALRYTTLMSHLPFWLHPEPQSALVICYGTGNTLRAMGEHKELQSIDLAELSPDVLKLGHYFSKANALALKDPRVKTFLNDGRNHLLKHQGHYDLITAEPPPPIHAHVVNLYTQEYFELCFKALKDKGVLCHWLPIYQIPKAETQKIIRAFLNVFPNASLWDGYFGELMLIGLKGFEGPISLKQLKERIQNSEASILPEMRMKNWSDVPAQLCWGPESLQSYVQGLPALRDNKPSLEYAAFNLEHNDHDLSLYQRQGQNQVFSAQGLNPLELKSLQRAFQARDRLSHAFNLMGKSKTPYIFWQFYEILLQTLKDRPNDPLALSLFGLDSAMTAIAFTEEAAQKYPEEVAKRQFLNALQKKV